MTWQVIHADCVEAMRGMDESSVDAIVTDPPYGLEFMGKEWDRLGDVRQPNDATFHKSGAGPFDRATVRYGYDVPVTAMQEWHQRWAAEALRVLKPGGHLLSFGGTRTYHRLACALEDAGFEIRDCLAWLYGSGFPKSLDISKAIDKAAGAAREVVGSKLGQPGYSLAVGHASTVNFGPQTGDPEREAEVTAPATPDAERWQGWGTALKPAFEPIVLARKPLSGTVAANVLEFGVGALNVDGTRIGTEVETWPASRSYAPGQIQPGGVGKTEATGPMPPGRWPANVLLDPEAAEMLDEQSGVGPGTGRFPADPRDKREKGSLIYGGGKGLDSSRGLQEPRAMGDFGGASRFFKIVRPDDYDGEPCEPANTAGPTSSQQGQLDVSAPSVAATSASPEATPGSSSPAPSTPGTVSGSRPNAESDTPPTPSTAAESSPESQQPRRTESDGPASVAETLEPTDTTTTTTSRSRSGGSADPATSSTMPNSPAPGGQDFDVRRTWYTAKTSRSERERGVQEYGAVERKQRDLSRNADQPSMNGGEGNAYNRGVVEVHNSHPTVKPVDLMQWLCRLITPPKGLILDPFLGSGSTGIAALREGFDFIGIEREAEYIEIARARIIGDAPLFAAGSEVIAEANSS